MRGVNLLPVAFLFALSSFAPSLARGDTTPATVTVCNRGQIAINVVIGTQPALQFLASNLDVVAWLSINPGACRQVYYGAGDSETGGGTERSYIGFGFYNSQGQLVAGHASRLPDFGTFTFGTPILAAADDRFCVRENGIKYRIPEHAVLNCATFRTGANDPGGYTSFPTVLEIQPRPAWWDQNDYINPWKFGNYYLDVTATRASPEIQITGRVGGQQQPDQSSGPSVDTQILRQLAKAAAERNQRLAQEPVDAKTRMDNRRAQMQADPVQAKARVEASVVGNVCVPDDLLAEWRNPPPGGKMEALQSQLKASLRLRATLIGFDQTKWMTVHSSVYSTWNPAGPFRYVVTATDGGSCEEGHHEILPLQ